PGDDRFLYASKTPLRDANGTIIGILGIAKDITQLKKLEAELIQAKALEAVGNVARPAAHDFNNILAAINGYAVLIMETLKAGNPVKPEIAQILKAVKRASAITDRLQTYAAAVPKGKGGARRGR
ncbi:MAG TPA: PAS domain-containing protein, partial [Elusimicrobiales bacterium]|nr:PAS domain-containing protein [Elusimicrobiales bacterium]